MTAVEQSYFSLDCRLPIHMCSFQMWHPPFLKTAVSMTTTMEQTFVRVIMGIAHEIFEI